MRSKAASGVRIPASPPFASVAQLDRVLGYEPSGQRFESFRVRHLLSSNFSFYQKQLTLYLVIFLDHQWFLINNFLVRL